MEKPFEMTESTYKVPNLEKGIAILELLAFTNKAMTLNDIKAEVDVSQTTVYRILHTLVRHGYLLYNDTSKKYKISRKMLSIGFQAIQEQSLLEVVQIGRASCRDRV